MKTKRILSLLCMLSLIAVSMSAFEYKGIKYSIVSSTDQTVTVAAGNTITGDITIPKLVMDASTATAYRVISISDKAFKDCTELTSVTFKAELTSIGSYAFANTGLTTITIPDAITVINESTFSGCASLTSVTLSSATTSIGKSAFANSGLTSIVIPEGVTAINESIFSGCASLASVTLSSATKSIGKSAFANSGLTSIVIPEGVTTINESTFSGCASLASVTLSSATKSIGKSAFANSGLTSIVIPEGVTTINESTFRGCASLASATLSPATTSIGDYAFYHTALTSIDIYKATKSIGKSTFEGCSELKSVNCTYEKMSIGADAFKDCVALECMNLVYDEPPYDYVDLGLSVKWATCNVGAENPEDYGSYFAWGETSPKSYYYYESYFDDSCTKYNIDGGKTTLDPENDAAYVNWGISWRMPTYAELEELQTKCTWTWTTQNGVKGCKVTGTNGNFIFLPAAGYRDGSYLSLAGSNGYYWSSSLNSSDSYYASDMSFDSGYHRVNYSRRVYGRSVRAVRSK